MNLTDFQGIIDPDAVTGGDLLAAFVVVIVSIIVAVLFSRLINRRLGRPGSQTEVFAALVARIIRWVIIFIGIAWALSYLGTDLGWFVITLGLVVVVVILVARPLIESLAASVILTTRPAYTIGDDVAVEGYQGRVIDVTNRSTVLQTRDGRRVHIPNTTVLKDTIVVYTGAEVRRTAFEITIDERQPIGEVEKVILAALSQVPEILAEPQPRIRARSFEDGVIRLSVRFWHAPSILAGNQALDQAIRVTQAALLDAAITTSISQDILLLHPATPSSDQ